MRCPWIPILVVAAFIAAEVAAIGRRGGKNSGVMTQGSFATFAANRAGNDELEESLDDAELLERDQRDDTFSDDMKNLFSNKSKTKAPKKSGADPPKPAESPKEQRQRLDKEVEGFHVPGGTKRGEFALKITKDWEDTGALENLRDANGNLRTQNRQFRKMQQQVERTCKDQDLRFRKGKPVPKMKSKVNCKAQVTLNVSSSLEKEGGARSVKSVRVLCGVNACDSCLKAVVSAADSQSIVDPTRMYIREPIGNNPVAASVSRHLEDLESEGQDFCRIRTALFAERADTVLSAPTEKASLPAIPPGTTARQHSQQ